MKSPGYRVTKSTVRFSLSALTALGILAGSIAFAFLFYSLGFSDANLVMAFLIGVVLVSLRTGWLAGAAASVVSVILFNFLFIEPRFTFAVYDTQYLFTFAVMLTVSLITSALTSTAKAESERAEDRERRTSVLYRMSRALLTVTGRSAVVQTALEQMRAAVPGSVAFFIRDSDGKISEQFPEEEHEQRNRSITADSVSADMDQIRRCLGNRNTTNGELGSLLESGAYCIPLFGSEGSIGALLYSPENEQEEAADDERSLLEAMTAQLALALDREIVSARHEETKVRAEREKLRATILRSISHDLRTPLAGITGASSTLLENADGMEEETKREMLTVIYEESTWLSELVDNLLSLSRVQSSGGIIRKTPEVLDDVLVSAVGRIRNRIGTHELSLKEPVELILVPMDGTLIEQVLINLIDNAIRHTPEGTRIAVSTRLIEEPAGTFVEFSVEDSGPGIPGHLLPHVFEPYKASASSERTRSRRGAGIGLGICRAIVEAHGGRIYAENTSAGGALIRFTLPIQENPMKENGDGTSGSSTGPVDSEGRE